MGLFEESFVIIVTCNLFIGLWMQQSMQMLSSIMCGGRCTACWKTA